MLPRIIYQCQTSVRVHFILQSLNHQQHFGINRCGTKIKKNNKSIIGFLQSISQSISRGICITLCSANLLMTHTLSFPTPTNWPFSVEPLSASSLFTQQHVSTQKAVGDSHRDTTQTFAHSHFIVSEKHWKNILRPK